MTKKIPLFAIGIFFSSVIALPAMAQGTAMPPITPHSTAQFPPITKDTNACVMCHVPNLNDSAKQEGQPTKLPKSHLGPDNKMAPARSPCLICHPQDQNAKEGEKATTPTPVLHETTAFEPVNADRNACLACHILDNGSGEKPKGMMAKMVSKTHAGDDGKISPYRTDCLTCHPVQANPLITKMVTPPAVLHETKAYEPITADRNACAVCHILNTGSTEKPKGMMAKMISKSHAVDGQLAENRVNCVACHPVKANPLITKMVTANPVPHETKQFEPVSADRNACLLCHVPNTGNVPKPEGMAAKLTPKSHLGADGALAENRTQCVVCHAVVPNPIVSKMVTANPIPHDTTPYQPVTVDKNACVLCHVPNLDKSPKQKGEVSKLSLSHLGSDGKVVESRLQCAVCHTEAPIPLITKMTTPMPVPHETEPFMPITADDNTCIMCHRTDIRTDKDSNLPVALPSSHINNGELMPSRLDCIVCHVSKN